jgi:hypothetical protein
MPKTKPGFVTEKEWENGHRTAALMVTTEDQNKAAHQHLRVLCFLREF